MASLTICNIDDTRKTTIFGGIMKKEYDFSKGIRGKFYKPDLQLNVPIYLDPEAYSFVERVAKKHKKTYRLWLMNSSRQI